MKFLKIILSFFLTISIFSGCNNLTYDNNKYSSFIGMNKEEIISHLSDCELLIGNGDFEIYNIKDDKMYLYVTYDDKGSAFDVQYEKIPYETGNDLKVVFNNNIEVDNLSFPIPEKYDKVLRSSYNEVHLINKGYAGIIEYHNKLSDTGWKLIKSKEVGSPITTYINDNQALVIMDEEISPNLVNVIIHHYQGIKSDNINKYENIIKKSMEDQNIYHIFEYDISEATTELGLRGFYVITEFADPIKVVIDKYDKITWINYDQFEVYDIDLDGDEEFITKLGFGIERYVITFSIFKYDEENNEMSLAYRTLYVQVGDVDMFLNKDENGVEVIAGTWNNGNIENQQSYGKLMISNGNIKPEKDDIPFEMV